MENSGPAQQRGRIPNWAKKAVPILVSVLILYHYFGGQDWGNLGKAVLEANLPLAIASILIPQLIFWFFEVLIADRLLTWFHAPFPWKTYVWVRGAMYLLMMINNTLGGGGMLVYLKRKTKISWKKLMGIMLFRLGITFWGIGFFMIPLTFRMHMKGIFHFDNPFIYIWWFVLIAGALWCVEAWIFWHYGKGFLFSRLVVRDRNSEFWTAFRVATKKQWLLTFAMSLPPLFLLFAGIWFMALAFGIKTPFWDFMALSPLMFMVIEMPISFAGFGTTTLGWNLFFEGYGTAVEVLCMTVFMPFARGLTRALIGLVSLRPAMKDIDMLVEEAAQRLAEVEKPEVKLEAAEGE